MYYFVRKNDDMLILTGLIVLIELISRRYYIR